MPRGHAQASVSAHAALSAHVQTSARASAAVLGIGVAHRRWSCARGVHTHRQRSELHARARDVGGTRQCHPRGTAGRVAARARARPTCGHSTCRSARVSDHSVLKRNDLADQRTGEQQTAAGGPANNNGSSGQRYPERGRARNGNASCTHLAITSSAMVATAAGPVSSSTWRSTSWRTLSSNVSRGCHSVVVLPQCWPTLACLGVAVQLGVYARDAS